MHKRNEDVLINPTWEQSVEREPLLAFSFYLCGRTNVLLALADEIEENLEQGFSGPIVLGDRVDRALGAATVFLRQVLENGPVPSKELEELALAQGIARATYDRARSRITSAARVGGVGPEGKWMTSLKSNDSTFGDTA